MIEFRNRLTIQRKLLNLINRKIGGFSLNGISVYTIQRWCNDNNLDVNSDLVFKIKLISKELQFLANRSQEAISLEYKTKVSTIENLMLEIEGMN